MLQLQLVDMDSSLGPIEVRPFVPLDTEQVNLPMLLKAGSVVAYDSKVWHRGGANIGDTPRPVLYTTWMAADDGLLPRNMGYTIAEADMAAWTLERLQDAHSERLDAVTSSTSLPSGASVRSANLHPPVPIEVAF